MGSYLAESDMAETAVPGKPQKPHGLDWRPVVNDYRAKAGRTGVGEIDASDPAADPNATFSAGLGMGPNAAPSSGASPAPSSGPRPAPDEDEDTSPINLRKFQEQLNRNRLDEIAALVLALTYGEMIEMASAIWQTQPDGSAITQENLPALLHRWSKSRSAVADG
jgi:hypothetical protein